MIKLKAFLCFLILSASFCKSNVEVSKAEIFKAADAANEFAFDLFAELTKEKGNVFFSPFSIYTALSMTYAGARKETAKEMEKAMHIPFPQDEFNLAIGVLLKSLLYKKLKADIKTEYGSVKSKPIKTSKYSLYLANAIWLQQGLNLNKKFLDITTKNYESKASAINFRTPEEACKIINKWTAKHTENKIKKILEKDNISDLTKMILTNAIYFKGSWQYKFDKTSTHKTDFYLNSKEEVSVDMMHQIAKFRYAGFKDARMLEMPYKGKKLSMLIFLPKEKDGIEKLKKKITVSKLKKCLKTLRKQEVKVFMPKFETTSFFSLEEKLKKIGMPIVFNPLHADFSGIANLHLYITYVLHKAFVKIDEKGTEAAAVTAIVMDTISVEQEPLRPTFRVDRPFIFLIRDKDTGLILFMGRIMNPLE